MLVINTGPERFVDLVRNREVPVRNLYVEAHHDAAGLVDGIFTLNYVYRDPFPAVRSTSRAASNSCLWRELPRA